MKTYEGVNAWIHASLTWALTGDVWSALGQCRFTSGERDLGTHWIRGWVGIISSLEDVEKRKFQTLLGLELRSLGRSARSQSLHRLRYPSASALGRNTSVTSEIPFRPGGRPLVQHFRCP
jgi:hypothetical protein